MACSSPKLERIVIPVPGTNQKRTLYRPRVSEVRSECDGFVGHPDPETPPGTMLLTDSGGNVYWLAPGSPGDVLRIGTDGIPFWSPV